MPLSSNSQFLVDALIAEPLVAGRFKNLKLVNYNSVADQKQGCFSLVFSADDELTGDRVALKFFDLDPQFFGDKYRRAAFDREEEILQSLVGKGRCLQLVAHMDQYTLTVPTANGQSVVFPCKFFAVQWLEDSIDDYFLGNDVEAVKKLKLFNEIVLAVEALHRNEIFHRDLKADNLRSFQLNLKKLVIAIDLGTAARFASGVISQSYGGQVGALGYAAPETRCSLAGNRILAPYTDIYALGCLLYELFNAKYFYYRQANDNPMMDITLAAMVAHLAGANSEADQVRAWNNALSIHRGGIISSRIDEFGSSVPSGIAPILNEILAALTDFDYSRRPRKLENIRQKIWSAIKIIENQKIYDARLARLRDERRKREEKLRTREQAVQSNVLRQAC